MLKPVPRKNPFPKRERQICRRVREVREHFRLTRVQFGKLSGIDSHLLTNYEHAKAQLNYQAAHRIIRAFMVNPEWLATGKEPKFCRVSFAPSPEALELGERALFSRVYDLYLTRGGMAIVPDDDDYRIEFESRLKSYIERWVATLPRESFGWIENAMWELDRETHSKQTESTEIVRARIERLRQRRRHISEILDIIHEYEERHPNIAHRTSPAVILTAPPENDLTHKATQPISGGDVKPRKQELEMPGLLSRLKQATKPTGKKTELAAFLRQVTGNKVPLANISRWLSGEREPGGEVALQLDAWATAQGFPRAK